MAEHNLVQRAANHRNIFARSAVTDPTASAVTIPDLLPFPKVVVPNVPKITLEVPVLSQTITTAVTSSKPVQPKLALPTTSSSTSVVVPSVTSVVPSVTPTIAISSTSHSTVSTVSTSTSFHTPATRVVKTSSAHSAVNESAAPSATTTATPSSGLGTGGLVGVIAGAVAFLIILAMIVAFFLRRIRKSKRAADSFNPALFRRSAVLLDDKEIDEKFSRPRPPTMIERHQNATAMQAQNGPASANLPKPSMAYPYSELSGPPSAPPSSYGNEQEQSPQNGSLAHFGSLPTLPQGGAYGNTLGAYGVPPPGAYAAQYEQAGYGAPPIPGTYGPGAYAAYGADPRSHQYPNQFTPQGYPNQISNFAAAQAQQQSYGSPHGAFIPNAVARIVSPSPPQLPPKPFSEKQALHLSLVQPEREASPSSSPLSPQPIQSSDAPPAYSSNEESDKWAANRDTPSSLSSVTVASANVSAPAQSSEVAVKSVGGTLKRVKSNARPPSSYSLYNQEDAYGGL